MKFDQTKFLTSVSFALDFVEMDKMKNVSDHNRRVAYISDCLAKSFALNDSDRLDLATCALLHDSGVAAYQFNIKGSRNSMEGPKEHCVYSQKILDEFPLNQDCSDVLLNHHEHIDGSGYFGKTDIHFFSKLIALSDLAEQLFNTGHTRTEVVQFIRDNGGSKFEQRISDSFVALSNRPAFWLDMEHRFIAGVLDAQLPINPTEMTWQEIREITKVLSSIIDMKSTFTSRHSSGLSEKAVAMAEFYKFDDDRRTKLQIAADLHDLGKLAIPNLILDKPAKLSNEEFEAMKMHTYYTRKALECIDGFEEIACWASNHHETLDGLGYPYGLKIVVFEEKLLAVLDIYQALTEDRPYRVGMTHDAAMSILNGMVERGKISREIVADVDKRFS